MKLKTVVAVVFALVGSLFTGANVGATPNAWTQPLEGWVIEDEQLANQWLASLNVSAPNYRHINVPSEANCVKAPAVFCPADMTVYVTPHGITQWLNPTGRIGSKYVIGHEVTHRLQDRHTVKGSPTELQANCGAGVFIRWLNDTGRAVSTVEDVTLLISVLARGDHKVSHGHPASLAYAFKTGYQGGSLAACEPIAGDLP